MELIVLDEPTTGLDPQGIIDIRNLILHLQKDLGKTVFFLHILSEIEMIATRMVIINKGKKLCRGKWNVVEQWGVGSVIWIYKYKQSAYSDPWIKME